MPGAGVVYVTCNFADGLYPFLMDHVLEDSLRVNGPSKKTVGFVTITAEAPRVESPKGNFLISSRREPPGFPPSASRNTKTGFAIFPAADVVRASEHVRRQLGLALKACFFSCVTFFRMPRPPYMPANEQTYFVCVPQVLELEPAIQERTGEA